MVVERGPYGRRSESRSSLVPASERPRALAPYRGETYYGLPSVKASHYGWLISTYFFVGGIAGGSQILATVADLSGRGKRRAVVRAGRYLALAGAAVSPVLLIADLHTPQRWYNMLRVFRKTSAMSIGSWTLAAFGTLSGLVAAGQLWEDVTGSKRARRLARILGVPAALAGAMMSVYTGSLLASTATPLWSSTPRLLPALFGASAASTASAAISLTLQVTGASEEEQRPVERFALAAGAAELALAETTRRSWQEQGVDEPLREGPLGPALQVGAIGLGVVVPLAIHGYQALTGKRSRTASTVAALATLAGGFLLRSAVLFAGNRSARQPEANFRLAQPGTQDRLADERTGRGERS